MTVIAAKNNTLLYLPFEGEHGETSFEDQSPYGVTIVPRDMEESILSGAVIDTNEKGSGNSSCNLVSTSVGTTWLTAYGLENLGEEDFTIEYFIKFRHFSDYRCLLDWDVNITYCFREAYESLHYPGSFVRLEMLGKQFTWSCFFNNFFIDRNAVYARESPPLDYALEPDAFIHQAFMRRGDNITFFSDGISQGTFSGAAGNIDPIEWARIGALRDFAYISQAHCYLINAWIDDFRITLGARHDGDFIPPSSPSDLDDEALALSCSLSMSMTYAISHAFGWLPGYNHRWRIIADRNKFFTDRENYYLPLLICNDVGINRADLSAIFSRVPYASRKKIAIALEDQTTEVPVKIRLWNSDRGLASIYAVIPKCYGRDWHKNTGLYFYYGKVTDGDNPNVSDI